MVDSSGTLVNVLGATFIPLIAGLFVPKLIAGISIQRLRMLMAFASGAILWFFLDVMNDAVLLGVNESFGGGLEHATLAAMFAIGLLILFGVEHLRARTRTRKTSRERNGLAGFSYGVALLVALGIGFHSFGEGVEIGSLLPTAPDIIQAIGGLNPAVSYVLHKFLEGFAIGVFATNSKLPRVLVLSLVGGIPTLIGSLLALLTPVNSTFFFALGGAGAVYVEYKLVPNFMNQDGIILYLVASLIGFYSMYLAGLLH